MTGLTIFLTLAGAFAFAGGAGWLAWSIAKRQGRIEAEKELLEDDAKRQAKAGSIVAEHRTDSDTAGRLQQGDF